jgi:hypothetical protein
MKAKNKVSKDELIKFLDEYPLSDLIVDTNRIAEPNFRAWYDKINTKEVARMTFNYNNKETYIIW